ncbi:MAG: hypothetical protein Q9163_000083 [Psora crenata]
MADYFSLGKMVHEESLSDVTNLPPSFVTGVWMYWFVVVLSSFIGYRRKWRATNNDISPSPHLTLASHGFSEFTKPQFRETME